MYTEKKILITGGLGFIGSNLARSLVKEGGIVTLVDSLVPEYGGNPFNISDIRDRLKINICDVRDAHAINFLVQDQDFLFNLAGQTSHLDSMLEPKTDLDINTAAQLSILEACKKHNPAIKIVFASTRQLYGKPDYLPVDEMHPIRPVDINGINKLSGESYHLLYNNVYGIRACALRLTNTYGPGMRVRDARQTFLGVWIRNSIENTCIDIYGDGTQLRDFNYVDDCVRALKLCGSSELADGKIYNLGGSEITELNSVARLLADLSPGTTYRTISFPTDRKRIDIGDYYGDYSLIRSELGWEPTVKLKDGLFKTLEYYAQHRNNYW
jgi:UDP-glucose 4-epimerase